MSETVKPERPSCCGECARFILVQDEDYDGFCDNWAGVSLKKTDVCHPNYGIKMEAQK